MTLVEQAYLAGFIDGEGCLTTIIRTSKWRRLKSLDVTLVVTNTHRGVLDWILTTLGMGRICEKKYEECRKTRCWAYVLDSHKLLPILQELLPHLRVKRKQAELAVSYLQSRAASRNRAMFNDLELRAVFDLRLETQRLPGSRIQYKKRRYTFRMFKKMLLHNRESVRYVTRWTLDMDAMLGKDTDGRTAALLGLTHGRVQERRTRLKIPPFFTFRKGVPTYLR